MNRSLRPLAAIAAAFLFTSIAAASLIRYEFSGVIETSSFPSLVTVGDPFSATLEIDYSTPGVHDTFSPMAFDTFAGAIRRFDLRYGGIEASLPVPMPFSVSYHETDRRFLTGSGEYWYGSDAEYEGPRTLVNIATIEFPQAGEPIPEDFVTLEDMLGVLPVSAFGVEIHALNVFLPLEPFHATTLITDARLTVLGAESPSVPTGGSTAAFVVLGIAGMAVGRCRRFGAR